MGKTKIGTLTKRELTILQSIDNQINKGNIKKISKFLGSNYGNVLKTINKLVARGLVIKKKKNNRIKVFLTLKGKRRIS